VGWALKCVSEEGCGDLSRKGRGDLSRKGSGEICVERARDGVEKMGRGMVLRRRGVEWI
jgi:hypothetical protein